MSPYSTQNYVQKRSMLTLFTKPSFIVARCKKKYVFTLLICLICNVAFSQFNFALLTPASPQTYSNQSNLVIQNKSYTNLSGDILNLNNCTNVTIRDCYFGASLGEAISISGGNNITIQNCFFANNRTGVYAVNTTGNLKVLNNQFVNMHGPFPRGQYTQLNACSGAGNAIQGNKGECFYGESYPEDLISLFETTGTQASPVTIRDNIFRGGGPSNSGGGIMGGDYGGQWVLVENNRLINPGQYGIAASGGYNVTINNNQVYAEQKAWNNIGYYVADYSNGAGCGNITLTNNKANYTNAGGSQNNFWSSGECSCTCNGTTSMTLASMNVPAFLFDIAEDKLWQIREDAWNFSGQIGVSRPTANALANFSTTSTSVTLTNTSGNNISAYRWVQVSGPNTSTIISSASSSTNVTGLVSGTYVFRLEVTHTNSAQDADWVTVTVNAGPSQNQAPTANAGNDINMTLPTVIATLTGSATDPDGTIASYSWSRVSGPTTFSITNLTSAITTVTGLIQGTYVFRLTATDDDGATDTDDVTVVVNPSLNQSPTADAGNDITLTLPTNSTTLSGSGSDPDGTIASYAWSRVSGPTTFTLGSANSATTTLSNLVQGTYVFRLTVTDNSGATATNNVTVTVNAGVPQPPIANAGSNITLTLPVNSTTLTGSGSDPDGTIASYAWSRVSGPTTFTLGSANSATTTLSNLVQGTYVFRLTVTDDDGATDTDDVTVTVNAAPNQAPTANAGSNITLTLPTNSTTLPGSGTDADGTITSYSWSRISGPTTFTFGSANAATTTLSNLVQGTYVFRLTVTDDDGATDFDNMTVTVNAAPNQAPTANAGNNIVLTLPANSTTLTGSGSDPDGTIASYAWSRVSGPTTLTLGSANAATTTLSNLVQGTYVFRLTVTDNSGAIATDDVTVTVNAGSNQSPTANAGNNIVLTLPTNSTTLTGSGSDPDGTIASYAWSRVSGPTTFTLGSANAVTTTLSNLVEGTYTFRLTVTDNSGSTATDDMTVIVNAATVSNQAPIANAGSNIVLTLPTNSTTLTGSGADTDGTIASYAWSRISGPTTFTLGSANTATTTLSNLVQGTYVFRLTVTDDDGATDFDNMTVTVNAAPNQTPTANAGSNIVLTLPANSTTLTGSGSDPDGTIASYAWSRVSGPTTFTLGSANAATTALNNLVQGTYTFRLTVTDNSGATATDDITVIVNAAPVSNQAPIADAGSNIILTLPANSATLTGSGTDADGTIAGYAWSRVSGPTTFTLGSANAATTTLSNLVQGTYVFRLTVTDNGGATATDDVTVTVNAAPNQAPTANAGNNIVLTLPTNSTTLTGSGTDADGTISSYAWSRVSGPTTFTLGSANADITALSNLVQGIYAFRLTVTDNSGATATDDVTVTINAAPVSNQAPIANAGSNIVLTLPANSATLTGSGADSDGTIASYAWSRVSGPTAFTLGSANAATTTLSNLVQGTYTFRLTVTDNSGATGTDNMTVIVNAAPVSNQAPIANAGNNIVISLPTNAITLNGSSSADPDGTIASYVWSRISGPTTFTLANANAATTALSNLVQGTYVFRLTVTDNGGATDSDNMTITVNAAPNQIPAANAGNNIVITLPVNSTTLAGSGSDPDGTIASYAWSRVSGPTFFTFTNANVANTALSNLVQGTYIFRLTVTDNSGASATDDVTVTVNAAPNQVPTARAGNDINMTLPANTTTLNGNTSTDPDGTIVSYSWSRVSGPTTFILTSAGSAATGLNNLVQGTYVFRLTVTDNDGTADTDDITVIVNAAPPNQAPTANAGSNIVLTLPTNSATLTGNGSDPDGTIAGYVWSRVSGPTTFTVGNTNSATTLLSNLVQGTYLFRLTVTDNRGATATDDVTVTVNAAAPAPNQLPVANAGGDQTIALPSNSATLSGSASGDPDGTISSYSWQQISGPGTSTFSSTTAATITVSNLLEGTYTYRLTVRDNMNASATDTVKITILNNFRIYGPVALYPNPASDMINIVLQSDSSGIVQFNIYDMQGRKVMPSVEVDKPRGFYTVSINVSQLRSGTYTVEAITSRYKKTVSKLVKL